jgi:carbamoyl-phosphate synthase large subunit
MLSTGEVMGIADEAGIAYAKSQIAAGNALPTTGTVLFSVKDADKPRAVEAARKLNQMGFKITATKGTCIAFINNNVPAEFVLKVSEGRPNMLDSIINRKVDLIVNTTIGKQAVNDSFHIRRTALDKQVPYVTTIRGAIAVAKAIEALKKGRIDVKCIQLYHKTKEKSKK